MNISELNKEYGILKSGSKYRIIKSFRDYDNYPYDEGNIVEFLGCSFLPYEDGLSLFCKYQDRDKQIRLQVRPEAQQVIAHNLEQYFQLID